MVFVFRQSSFRAQPNSSWTHLRISLALMACMVAYTMVGAMAFLYLNPESASQGNDITTTTTFRDAVYFIVVTLTTVGYGDVVPSNDRTKIFLSGYILLSLLLVGVVLDVTDYLYQINVDIEEEEEEEEEEEAGGPDDPPRYWTAARRKFVFAIFMVLVLVMASTLFFVFHEGFTVVDSVYFSVVTLTTVGYGDITPRTEAGQVFSIFWIGLGCLALFRAVGALMDIMLESRKARWKRQRNTKTAVLRRHLSARWKSSHGLVNMPDTEILAEYSKQDLVDVLTKMEYILARLEKQGRINADDLADLDKDFKKLTPEEISNEFSAERTSSMFRSLA